MFKTIIIMLGKKIIMEILEEIMNHIRNSPEQNPMAEQIVATRLNQIRRENR